MLVNVKDKCWRHHNLEVCSKTGLVWQVKMDFNKSMSSRLLTQLPSDLHKMSPVWVRPIPNLRKGEDVVKIQYPKNEDWEDPILGKIVERQDNCSYYNLYDIYAVFSTCTILVNISSTFFDSEWMTIQLFGCPAIMYVMTDLIHTSLIRTPWSTGNPG